MPTRTKITLSLGLLGLLLVFTLTYLIKPISDADFFWHVATGKWILQHHTIPQPDPFAYTSPAGTSLRQEVILGGYWLSQVLYALLYEYGGDAGIIALRVMVVVIIGYGFTRHFQHRLVDPSVVLVLVLLFFSVHLPVFALERPHTMSFILFLFSIVFLEEFNDRPVTEPKALLIRGLLFGSVFFLWSCLHPGYILGALVLAVWTINGLLYALRSGTMATVPTIAVVVTGSLGGMLIRGGKIFSFDAIREMVSPSSKYLLFNYEQMSTLKYFLLFKNEVIIVYWALMLLAVVPLLQLVRLKRYHLAVLLAGTTCFAFFHIRYIPFFLIVLILSLADARWLFETRPRRRILFGASVAVALYLVSFHLTNIKNFAEYGLVRNEIFPVRAADYILAAGELGPNMFNDAISGGYLAWRLFPRYQVFTDGRTLNETAYLDSMGFSLGGDFWRNIAGKYGISFIVLTKIGSAGSYDDLVSRIESDPGWTVVYQDEHSSVLKQLETIR